ncbi:MAG: hypothetical protein RIM33_08230 [Alphaproteobacteria bacterium]
MALGDSTLFGMMTQRMDWLSQRQRVLSENIANSDTPDYAARDLEQLSFSDTMQRQQMQVTLAVSEPQHVAMPQADNRFEEGSAGSVYETSVSENSVVLEEQVMKMAQTSGEFNVTTNLYKKYLALHRIALGRNGGG